MYKKDCQLLDDDPVCLNPQKNEEKRQGGRPEGWSSRPEVFCKGVLKNLGKFWGNICADSIF